MNRHQPEKGNGLALYKGRLMELFQRYKYALLVVAVGVVMMALPTLSGGGETTRTRQQSAQEVEFGTEELEGRLEEALSQMDGVGQAEVVLTLRSGPGQVLAQDTQNSVREEGSESSQSTVVLSKGSGYEEPVILNSFRPNIRGLLWYAPAGTTPQYA